jgi:hypothetical protein
MQALSVVMMRRNQMNDNIRNMLQYSLIGDEDEFKLAFDAEVNDRIADKLAQKHVDVTSTVLKRDEEEESEEE